MGGSASLIVALAASRAFGLSGVVREMPSFVAYPFQLGVASGDPTADGFVLWTRLAPKPLAGGGLGEESMRVHWQVAEDEAMTRLVAQGSEVASPDWAHSVHVEVAGLQPDRWYWYQFKVGQEISPLGRTRTLAAVGTDAAHTSRLKMTFASCQHFEAGLYTAYQHMLAEAPDIVFHLGDYIYEGPGREQQVRLHQGKEIQSLADYRNRHAQYKCDRSLQAMHAAAPWVVTWDDHELDNNCAGGVSEKLDADPGAFLKRRAAAYQAYYEHMPLRKSCIPSGPDMQLYRSVHHGGLVSFQVLDTRQYRTDQPNGDGLKDPGSEALNPDSTILGKTQRDWLFRELGASQARWNVLSQQVMMARVDRDPGPGVKCSMDQWAGYEVDRRAVLQAFLDLEVANPVVITGDIHSHWANDLTLAPAVDRPQVVAAEFVGTSISSGGDGAAQPANHDAILRENPEVKFYNAQRGYVSCEIGPDLWRADYRNVGYISRPGAALETTASFVVENGKPGLQRA
jgi:alkaline phosphatase D